LLKKVSQSQVSLKHYHPPWFLPAHIYLYLPAITLVSSTIKARWIHQSIRKS